MPRRSGFLLPERYRFYPTDRQQRDLTQLCDRVGAFWNDTLTLGKDSEKLPATGELQKLGVTLEKQTSDREWLGNALALSLQQSINDLGVASKKILIR
ncbi:MAG: hypothetical protein MUE44_36920 [Oscillatoriaceae cyanobacterium Prado104]|jgi:hypothetical protein|nr:hypothetical protein [Oscillatoriaceae cyanobacterium Prado104]